MRRQLAVRIEIFVNLETNLIFFFLSHVPPSSADPSFHLALPAEMEGRKVRRRRRRFKPNTGPVPCRLQQPPPPSHFKILWLRCLKFQDKAGISILVEIIGLEDCQRSVLIC